MEQRFAAGTGCVLALNSSPIRRAGLQEVSMFVIEDTAEVAPVLLHGDFSRDVEGGLPPHVMRSVLAGSGLVCRFDAVACLWVEHAECRSSQSSRNSCRSACEVK